MLQIATFWDIYIYIPLARLYISYIHVYICIHNTQYIVYMLRWWCGSSGIPVVSGSLQGSEPNGFGQTSFLPYFPKFFRAAFCSLNPLSALCLIP